MSVSKKLCGNWRRKSSQWELFGKLSVERVRERERRQGLYFGVRVLADLKGNLDFAP